MTVRGLRQISGEAEFNEVFFDDVHLEADAVVRPGRRRLADGADDAHVRAPHDRPRHRGPRLQGGPLRAGARRRRRRAPPTPTSARRLGEIAADLIAVKFGGYRALTALQRGQIPGPEAGLGEGHARQRGDRGGRARRRHRSAPTRSRTARVGVHDLVPARAEVGGRHRGDPAQHDRRARARPAAGAAARQGHPVQRAAQPGARGGAGIVDEPRAVRRAGAPPRGRARLARARETRRRRPRRARGPGRRARPLAARRRGRLARTAVSEDHGGAGLGAFDAMLVAQECGRVLAGVPLLGALPATALLDAAGHERLEAIAAGEIRAGVAPGAPARRADADPGWTVERARRMGRERRAARGGRRRRGAVHGHRRVGPRRARAPTCSSSSA